MNTIADCILDNGVMAATNTSLEVESHVDGEAS